MEALDISLSANHVPCEIAKAIRYIVREYSVIFSSELYIATTHWNNKTVYLVNSADSRLNYAYGIIHIGRNPIIKIDAGFAIFARRRYCQALWIFSQKQVALLGIPR